MSALPSICIVQPTIGTVSETFIRAHAERLPARVRVVQPKGASAPPVGSRPVLSQSRLSRRLRSLKRRLTGRGARSEMTAGLIKAFREAKAEAVLAEYGHTGVRALEACQETGLPLIVHFHGWDASRHDVLSRNRQAYPKLFEHAAAIVAVSQAMRAKLIDLGAPPEKVHYNPYGVDCNHFRATNPAANRPSFLAVGRFVEKKGPHLTLMAFREVLQECDTARLRMIGDGPLLGACRDLAQVMGMADAVQFLGAQPHARVAVEMGSARAFVQHSIEASDGDSEGTPNAVLEAAASGLPVIATRHGGIPDVVMDRETGLLVDERDVTAMAGRMIQLAQDGARAGQLGAKGRVRIESHFRMEQSIARLWEIIESCMEHLPLKPAPRRRQRTQASKAERTPEAALACR